MKIIYTKKYTR